MSKEISDLIAVVTALITLTQEQKLQWKKLESILKTGMGAPFVNPFRPTVYVAPYREGQFLRLTAIPTFSAGAASPEDPPLISLELINVKHEVLYNFAYIAALNDLYRAVDRQTGPGKLREYFGDLLE